MCSLPDRSNCASISAVLSSVLITKDCPLYFFFFSLPSICPSRLGFRQDLRSPIEVLTHCWPATGWRILPNSWRMSSNTAQTSSPFAVVVVQSLSCV